MIKNRADLERFHGKGASAVLAALEAAINSVEPGSLVRRAVSYDKGAITVRDICGKRKRLSGFDNVYVVGAGKATAAMAEALYEMLGSRVSAGAINVPPKKGNFKNDAIVVTHASHPVPDENGVRGAKKILDIVRKADEDDLVIVLISGGGSALMPLPAKGVSLKDKQDMTARLLASGASIQEINVVRKHLSAIKGGRLVQKAKCTIASLILSDVIGDDIGAIASGPTYPDSSTFADAMRIIKKYDIDGPAAVVRHIESGVCGRIQETPKKDDPVFFLGRVHNFLIGNNAFACKAAVESLRRSGLKVKYIGSEYGGAAEDFGKLFSRTAANLKARHAVVAGGETTVRLGKNPGMGGRNQQAALAYALSKPGNAVAAFMGTDGIDGNSDAAGAIISQKSMALAEKILAERYLVAHDSYHALEKMNALLFTGLTGTNVNDIAVGCRLSSY
ncbi:MAG: DUF4147 domain-containing protein [Nitrososphaera sp.]